MKKIFVLIGIIMFSLTVMADDSRYGFIPQPQQNYDGGYSSGYDDENYRSHGSSSLSGNASDWYGNSSISDRRVGALHGSGEGLSRTLLGNSKGDSDDNSNGSNRTTSGTGDLYDEFGNPKSPVGDAILPLSLMSLIFAGFVYLKKVRK